MTIMKTITSIHSAFLLGRVHPVLAVGLALLAPWAAAQEARVLKDVSYLEAGRTEKLDLYLPAQGNEAVPRPAVVWIHGGALRNLDKGDARERDVCTSLSAAGYVCASINYRLGDGAWPTNLFDCKNAVRFLRAHAAEYNLNPAAIAVMGGSAGGYLAQMVGFTVGEEGLETTAPYPGVSSAVSAIGNFYGSSDYLTTTQPAKNGNRTDVLTDLTSHEKIFGVPHGADRSVWRKFSPIGHITSSAPPVLILHGLADPNSDYEQAIELAQVLADKGVSHQLIMLAGVGHSFGLTSVGNKKLPRDLRPAVIDFLRSYGLAAPSMPAGN